MWANVGICTPVIRIPSHRNGEKYLTVTGVALHLQGLLSKRYGDDDATTEKVLGRLAEAVNNHFSGHFGISCTVVTSNRDATPKKFRVTLTDVGYGRTIYVHDVAGVGWVSDPCRSERVRARGKQRRPFTTQPACDSSSSGSGRPRHGPFGAAVLQAPGPWPLANFAFCHFHSGYNSTHYTHTVIFCDNLFFGVPSNLFVFFQAFWDAVGGGGFRRPSASR